MQSIVESKAALARLRGDNSDKIENIDENVFDEDRFEVKLNLHFPDGKAVLKRDKAGNLFSWIRAYSRNVEFTYMSEGSPYAEFSGGGYSFKMSSRSEESGTGSSYVKDLTAAQKQFEKVNIKALNSYLEGFEDIVLDQSVSNKITRGFSKFYKSKSYKEA